MRAVETEDEGPGEASSLGIERDDEAQKEKLGGEKEKFERRDRPFRCLRIWLNGNGEGGDNDKG